MIPFNTDLIFNLVYIGKMADKKKAPYNNI